MSIGSQIKLVRNERGDSIALTARTAGCTGATVHAVEAGGGSIRSMTSLLSALELKLEWPTRAYDCDLGTALSIERRNQNISQREMAALIGVTQPTVVALERQSTGRVETLRRYFNALGVGVSVRSEGNEPPNTRRLVPPRNNPDADIIYTPRSLAKHVIDYHPLDGIVLDPCRGDGAFFDQFPKRVDARWCEITEGRDFLRWQEPTDWIISNPPWSKFRAFLLHAMTVSDNVVFLAALSHFTTKARIRDIQSAGFGIRSMLLCPTPEDWPHSGFQVAAVWLERGWTGTCRIAHNKPEEIVVKLRQVEVLHGQTSSRVVL